VRNKVMIASGSLFKERVCGVRLIVSSFMVDGFSSLIEDVSRAPHANALFLACSTIHRNSSTTHVSKTT